MLQKKNSKNYKKIKNKNLEIYGYGATSKSTTILHFCNVKNEMINSIFDNTPTKINKYFPGKKNKDY